MIPESIALSPKGLHISATESIIGSKQLGRAVSDLVPISKETLTSAQFDQFADVSPELEWLANITNPKTRRAYKVDVEEFVRFTGLQASAGLRTVTRAHVIAWRKALEARNLTPSSILRKLSVLASFYDYLCERNAVVGNPVDGVNINPENLVVLLATNCHEGASASTSAVSVVSGSEDSKLVSFLLPGCRAAFKSRIS